MSSITTFLSGGVKQYFSSDVITLIIIFVFFFVYALYFGKSRIISFILAFYPAQFFYEHFPFISSTLILKGESLLVLNKLIVFVLIWTIFSILFGRYVFHDSGFGSAHYLRMAGYAISGLLLVLILSYSVINLDVYHNFSGSIDALFNSPTRIFWWNLAPLALLFLM